MHPGIGQGASNEVRNASLLSGACLALTLMACSFSVAQAPLPRIPQNASVTRALGSGHGAGYQRQTQQRQPQKAVIDRRLETLTQQLDLNEVQRFDTRKILESGQVEAKRLWAEPAMSPIDRMTKLRALRENSQKQFRALLTEQQRTKYDQILQQRASANSATSQASSSSATSAPAPHDEKDAH